MQGKHYFEHSQFADRNFHYLVHHRSNHHNQGEVLQKIYKLQSKVFLRGALLSFIMIPIPFIAFEIFGLIYSLRFNLMSKYTPKYFWQWVCWTSALLKMRSRCNDLTCFLKKYNLLNLFAYIKIEWHFMCPFRYFLQIPV